MSRTERDPELNRQLLLELNGIIQLLKQTDRRIYAVNEKLYWQFVTALYQEDREYNIWTSNKHHPHLPYFTVKMPEGYKIEIHCLPNKDKII